MPPARPRWCPEARSARRCADGRCARSRRWRVDWPSPRDRRACRPGDPPRRPRRTENLAEPGVFGANEKIAGARDRTTDTNADPSVAAGKHHHRGDRRRRGDTNNTFSDAPSLVIETTSPSAPGTTPHEARPNSAAAARLGPNVSMRPAAFARCGLSSGIAANFRQNIAGMGVSQVNPSAICSIAARFRIAISVAFGISTNPSERSFVSVRLTVSIVRPT